MKNIQIVLVVVCAVLAVGIYWLSRPLPNFEDAWKYRLFSLAYVNGKRLARFSAWCSGGNALDIERYLLIKYANIPNRKGPFVTVKVAIKGVPVNIYYPSSDVKKAIDSKEELFPAIIYFHGGGFVYPSAGHEDVCIDYAMAVNAVVISVDYHLSPEHPCPTAADECYTLTKHILLNGNKYGLDSKRIIVMGDSAGGNLAASTSLRLAKSDPDINQPKFQMLIVPVLQMFSFNLTSHQEEYTYPEFLTSKQMAWYSSAYLTGSFDWKEILLSGNHTKHLHNTIFASYLGLAQEGNYDLIDHRSVESPVLPKHALQSLLNPFYFPLMAHNLTGVPPIYIVTNQYDILRNEGELYVSRLRKARVPVTHKHYFGFHSSNLFYNASKVPFHHKAAIEMTRDIVNFVKENL